ncbi:MAG TPA: phosphatase PAP2 family protein [Dehalococcoidia bacterium]
MEPTWDVAQASYLWARWLFLAALLLLVLYQGRASLNTMRLGREAALVLLAVFTYFAVRELTEGSVQRAEANAALLVRLEEALGIFREPALQHAILDHHGLVTLANWVYIWGHWPFIALVAVWLFLRRPGAYRRYRNAFIVSGAMGLLLFMTFPVAPPRLAVDVAVVDTVSQYSHAYRVLQPPSLVNQYAAFPSLHFGWDLLIGLALVREARALWARLLGLLAPLAMFAAIVLTANHYIVDGVAGAAVALLGLWLAARLWPDRTPHDRASASPGPLPTGAGPRP